jgi:hypothetical protein
LLRLDHELALPPPSISHCAPRGGGLCTFDAARGRRGTSKETSPTHQVLLVTGAMPGFANARKENMKDGFERRLAMKPVLLDDVSGTPVDVNHEDSLAFDDFDVLDRAVSNSGRTPVGQSRPCGHDGVLVFEDEVVWRS